LKIIEEEESLRRRTIPEVPYAEVVVFNQVRLALPDTMMPAAVLPKQYGKDAYN
jgi:hypothetical protein